MNNLSPKVLRELLRYEPETGKLFWRERPVEMFSTGRGHYTAARAQKTWNTRFANKEAFKAKKDGYLTGVIFRRRLRSHRVIWAMVTGAWPTKTIDHKDGNRSHNLFDNFRDVSRSVNMRNQKLNSRNKSGTIGVDWHKSKEKWRATIKVNRRQKHIGYFEDLADAAAARKTAEVEFGYHPNHGR